MVNDVDQLTSKQPAAVLRDTDRDSVGVVRVLANEAGTPGEEREYKAGDEALVEAGLAEWVVAPVHLPSAGRRLDHDAEREPAPLSGVEAYPPAEPTTATRRVKARQTGSVEAHSDEGLGEKLAARRSEVARGLSDDDGDAARQARLGGLGARSGPVTARSDLEADQALVASAESDGAEGGGSQAPKAAQRREAPGSGRKP